MAAMDPDSELAHDFRPFIQQYKSGRVVRFDAADTVPAGTDPAGTVVSSKDVVINSKSGLWARLYLPPLPVDRQDQGVRKKLPVVVYYHGGAFVLGSAAARPEHLNRNGMAADANVLVVSPEYRLAPEHPLPTAHEDSWEALEWVASHAAAAEPWIAEHADLSRVFVAGFSAGGNIAHYVAARAGARGLGGVTIRGLLLAHPFFNGEVPVGNEAAASSKWNTGKPDAFWRFVCPDTPGLDDPLCNPFSEAAGGSAALVAAERVLVCVAGMDDLRDRGVWYYESLKASGYRGEVELHESEGKGHVFHYEDPAREQARALHARVVSFLRDQ